MPQKRTEKRNCYCSGKDRIECKIDRALINDLFHYLKADYNGQLLTPSLSDHNPILIIGGVRNSFKNPFRHFNAWAKEKEFFGIVKEAWIIGIVGTPMYKLVKKLANVKRALTTWQRSKVPTSNRIYEARCTLEDIQRLLVSYVCTHELLEAEKEARANLNQAESPGKAFQSW